MLRATLSSLRSFPDQLEEHFAEVPRGYLDWRPASWDGIPSEHFTAIEQLCHVRDIEIDGYHVRLRRMLDETAPLLVGIDSEALAGPRRYSEADPSTVITAIRAARATTVEIVSGLGEAELRRDGSFEGYGRLTLKALIHYLCSHDQQHLAGIEWLLGQIDSDRLRT
jgi:DinB superfamily